MVSERRCDGWEGKHSMQRNYLYNYYPILTYQCISSPENESIGWNESCMDTRESKQPSWWKWEWRVGQKRTKGAGLQLEAAAALATWKRETRRGRTCHTSNDSDSDWGHVLYARQSQCSSLRSYFTMTRTETLTCATSFRASRKYVAMHLCY